MGGQNHCTTTGQVQVLKAGGLCEQEIREHVCNIMEGGATAFDKRYNRLRVQ